MLKFSAILGNKIKTKINIVYGKKMMREQVTTYFQYTFEPRHSTEKIHIVSVQTRVAFKTACLSHGPKSELNSGGEQF